MQILHRLADGVQERAGLPFGEALLLEDLVQQLPSSHQLRHQVDVPAITVHLPKQRGSAAVAPKPLASSAPGI